MCLHIRCVTGVSTFECICVYIYTCTRMYINTHTHIHDYIQNTHKLNCTKSTHTLRLIDDVAPQFFYIHIHACLHTQRTYSQAARRRCASIRGAPSKRIHRDDVETTHTHTHAHTDTFTYKTHTNSHVQKHTHSQAARRRTASIRGTPSKRIHPNDGRRNNFHTKGCR
jgi:hypothetical protein